MLLRTQSSPLFPYTTLFRSRRAGRRSGDDVRSHGPARAPSEAPDRRDRGCVPVRGRLHAVRDRKSTRLNSSHTVKSYAVFCLKKKKEIWRIIRAVRGTGIAA